MCSTHISASKRRRPFKQLGQDARWKFMIYNLTSHKSLFILLVLIALSATAEDFASQNLIYPKLVTAFYETNGQKNVWDDRLRQQLQQGIAGADQHGLQPANYHFVELENGSDASCTDAFFAYAHDLRFGRTSDRLKGTDWQVKHNDADLIPILQNALKANDIRKHLEDLAPSFESYKLLQKQLELYRALEGWQAPLNPLDLEKGDQHQLELLTSLLKTSGDLRQGVKLIDAVMRFQSRHGLRPDGIVGKQTITALKIQPSQRVTQIELNLERMRWLPHDLPNQFLLVNVPAFELRIYERHQLIDKMRVIVGRRTWCTPTFLNSAINQIILNPFWYVPSAIANKEIYPLLEKEPDYLEKNNIQIIQDKNGDVRLRQPPGEKNSLGRIKFLFPNCCDCYLHDTPEKQLFDKVLRSFSHGCIRVEDAFRLADSILENEGWTKERLSEAIASGKTQTVSLTRQIPIYIVYFTAWVDSDGSLQFRNDVYSKDQRLASVLGAQL
jgi:L,D-transpeptidase YcbB